jgi:hypothetical protein
MIVKIVNILILATVPYMIWKRQDAPLRPFFWPAYIMKVAAGITLGVIYLYYYKSGDTIGYFEDGVKLVAMARGDVPAFLKMLVSSDVLPESQGFSMQAPRAIFFTKLVSVVMLLSGPDYWITACYFSLVSFVCAWFLVREITQFNGILTFPAVIALLFFPSVVLWSAGVIKESVAMACLFFIVAVFLRIWRAQRVQPVYWMLLAIALWLLWSLKYYYMAVLLPVLAAELFMQRVVRPRVSATRWRVVLWLVVFLFPAAVAGTVHPNFYPEHFLNVIVSNYEAFVAISDPRDVMTFDGLDSRPSSLLKHVPAALVGGLFRPFIWESSSVFQIAASIENTVLLLLSGGVMLRWRTASLTSPLVWPALLYCFLLCGFLTLSTPNFGTLSRYRVGFLPFFVLLLLAGNPLPHRIRQLTKRFL